MKKFLPIGTVVEVKGVVDVGYFGPSPMVNPDKKKLERVIYKETKIINKPFIGVIVGGTYVMEGEVNPGYGPSYFDLHDAEPAYLAVSKATFVYLVRRGFVNKALKVLPEDLTVKSSMFLSSPNVLEFPFRHARRVEWNEQQRSYLREDMKRVPRDPRGRWMKLEPIWSKGKNMEQVYKDGRLVTINK